MKTAKERLEELIKDIDGSLKPLVHLAENDKSMISSSTIGIAVLTNAKATALAALVQVEHASAGDVKSFGEMWKDIASHWDEMHSNSLRQNENEMKEMVDRMNKRRGFRRGKDSSDL